MRTIIYSAHSSRTGYDKIIEKRILYMLGKERKFRETMDALLEGRSATIIMDNISYQESVMFYCYS
jgi:hypothetical protein